MAKTYYELLDVPPSASADEIKRAFRREIAKYHPDKVQHLGEEFQEIAATKAAELTRAYKALTDPAVRKLLTDQGAESPPLSLAELRDYVRSEKELYGAIVRAGDMKAD